MEGVEAGGLWSITRLTFGYQQMGVLPGVRYVQPIADAKAGVLDVSHLYIQLLQVIPVLVFTVEPNGDVREVIPSPDEVPSADTALVGLWYRRIPLAGKGAYKENDQQKDDNKKSHLQTSTSNRYTAP